MARRDLWFAVVAILLALVAHALLPRYEWRHVTGVFFVRIDRWTGRAQYGHVRSGEWRPSGGPDRYRVDQAYPDKP